MVLFFQIQPFKNRVCKRASNQAIYSFADLVKVYASLFAIGIPTGQPKFSHPTVSPQVVYMFLWDVLFPSPWHSICCCPLLTFYFLVTFGSIYFYAGLNGPLSQMDLVFLLNFCTDSFQLPSLFPFPPHALPSPPILSA